MSDLPTIFFDLLWHRLTATSATLYNSRRILQRLKTTAATTIILTIDCRRPENILDLTRYIWMRSVEVARRLGISENVLKIFYLSLPETLIGFQLAFVECAGNNLVTLLHFL